MLQYNKEGIWSFNPPWNFLLKRTVFVMLMRWLIVELETACGWEGKTNLRIRR